jgi:UDP-2,3-diacylglucosamine pyrophosphatase LpxH
MSGTTLNFLNVSSRPSTINLGLESFNEVLLSRPRKSAKENRAEFSEELKRIRRRCEVTYHRALLSYIPERQRSDKFKVSQQQRGVWYSDTHLLCRRSDAAPLLKSLHNVLERCQYLVAVGDEFDFAWSEIKDPIAAAVDYKIRLAKRYPHCTFHTVLGNHDGSEEYLKALQEASKIYPNIVVHRYAVKLGKYLFTHGDCVHWNKTSTQVLDKYRHSFNNGWLPSQIEKVADRIIHTIGVHRKVPELLLEIMLPRKLQAERILSFIRHLDLTLLDGVEYVCSGHTHKKFRGFKHAGYNFSNGGAHERGFRPALNRFSVSLQNENIEKGE